MMSRWAKKALENIQDGMVRLSSIVVKGSGMPTSSQQGFQLLTMEDVDRILDVTDSLQLHRDWVIIPIDAVPEPRIVQQPDAKIIIHAPVQEHFEPWLRSLRDRLQELDLGRVPRKIVD